MKVDQHEVEHRYTEYAIHNLDSGKVLDERYDTQRDAEFDALLYPSAVVVSHQVYETKWVQSGELRDFTTVD